MCTGLAEVENVPALCPLYPSPSEKGFRRARFSHQFKRVSVLKRRVFFARCTCGPFYDLTLAGECFRLFVASPSVPRPRMRLTGVKCSVRNHDNCNGERSRIGRFGCIRGVCDAIMDRGDKESQSNPAFLSQVALHDAPRPMLLGWRGDRCRRTPDG